MLSMTKLGRTIISRSHNRVGRLRPVNHDLWTHERGLDPAHAELALRYLFNPGGDLLPNGDGSRKQSGESSWKKQCNCQKGQPPRT